MKNLSQQISDRHFGREVHDRWALAISGSALLGWCFLLTWKYLAFGYYDWDLALYAQSMWLLLHGSFDNTILGMNFLANHAEYISFLLVPIYAIFPHPLTLVYLKVFSFVVGVFMLYVLAKKAAGPVIALLWMTIFLLYPANILALFYEFHMESLSIGPLFLLYYFFQEEKPRPFLITMLLTSLIKENMSPLIVAFGIYAMFHRSRNRFLWAGIPVFWGIIWFYLSMFIITPSLRGGLSSPNQYLYLFSDLGGSPGEILQCFIFHPQLVVQRLLRPENISYLSELFGPFLFLPILSPDILFLAAPVFAQHLLSSAAQQQTISYHYAATLAPFIFLAAVQALRRIRRFAPRLFYLSLTLMLFAHLINFQFYKGQYAYLIRHFQRSLNAIRWEMVKTVPAQSGVLATGDFLAPLSARRFIYPHLHLIREHNSFTGQRFILPGQVNFLLLDFNDFWLTEDLKAHHKRAAQVLQQLLRRDWFVKDAVEDLVLFEKGAQGKDQLIERSTKAFMSRANHAELSIDDRFSLLAYERGENTFGRSGVIPFVFYWRADAPVSDDYEMIIVLGAEGSEDLSRTRTIGYTLYPTYLWEKGDYFRERYWLYFPRLKSGEYRVRMMFINKSKDRVAQLKFAGAGRNVPFEVYDLGIFAIK